MKDEGNGMVPSLLRTRGSVPSQWFEAQRLPRVARFLGNCIICSKCLLEPVLPSHPSVPSALASTRDAEWFSGAGMGAIGAVLGTSSQSRI